MKSFCFQADDQQATDRLGAMLAESLPNGAVVALHGTLGAGKTRLVQAVAQASGVPPGEVVSPTFILLAQYQGRRPVNHFDVYRLRDEDEFLDLGPEEYFEGDGITFIEWAERVESCLPPDRLDIRIEVTGPTSRRFEIASDSPLYAGFFDRLRAACS